MTTIRITRSLALSFSPRVEIHLLRLGTDSATMIMARLLPRLERFQ